MAENSDGSESARHHLQYYNAAADLIERNLAVRPEKIAYIDDNGRYTFAELAERVNRCAHALCELGATLESRILVVLAIPSISQACFSEPSRRALFQSR